MVWPRQKTRTSACPIASSLLGNEPACTNGRQSFWQIEKTKWWISWYLSKASNRAILWLVNVKAWHHLICPYLQLYIGRRRSKDRRLCPASLLALSTLICQSRMDGGDFMIIRWYKLDSDGTKFNFDCCCFNFVHEKEDSWWIMFSIFCRRHLIFVLKRFRDT